AMGGVVISTKRMNRILEIDLPNRRLRAQSGIANIRLTEAVRADGFHFAPDPSSQTVSTLGGNIAENSGGPHTLKYGVTAQHILSVTMVDTEGAVQEIGDGVPEAPGPNLLGLLVGSEGTLGIVTEACVKLTPLPERVATMLVSFRSVRGATEAVASIMDTGVVPAALEMMDHFIFGAVKAAFGLEVPDGAQAMLLIECDGDQADEEILSAREVCERFDLCGVRIAANAEERAHLWTVRKKGIGAMGRLAPTVVTHDGVIPRSRLPEMLELVYQVAEQEQLGVANIFHAGDGNLHPIFYFDDREPGIVDRVVRAGETILRECVRLGGSVTGEHGVGVEKIDFMDLMFSPDDLELMHDAKGLFPTSPFSNPCKVLPNQKGCIEHMRRWKGAAT
ncbi:MAG: FAD-binding protein, partial [Fimbriimonadaceae bacterium]|nr:FAD-binding protein [Fimbriimonadaceae bacterium]